MSNLKYYRYPYVGRTLFAQSQIGQILEMGKYLNFRRLRLENPAGRRISAPYALRVNGPSKLSQVTPCPQILKRIIRYLPVISFPLGRRY